MRVIVQRSLSSSVSIDGKDVGKISRGMVLLVGFTLGDGEKEINYMVKKIVNLRIFDDENGIMNKSILDTNGEVLSISQFTLYANTNKGNRPSYVQALKSSEASKLYDLFNEKLKSYVNVKTGIFGADMLLNIQNDGPVTVCLERKGII